jgi:nickel/cobalt transporter (NicO) family protein
MGYGGILLQMNGFSHLLQQGASHAWLFFPTAIVLGALHGLEPGHSKTMMAAFIVAIRGTIAQAVLLGVSAAVSHSLVIWALAALALKFGSRWNAESAEPYFQIASAVIVGGLAFWMFWRTRQEVKAAAGHSHHHTHTHEAGHQEPAVIQSSGEIAREDSHQHGHHDLLHGEDFEDAHERAHAAEIEKRFAGRQVSTGQILLFGLTGGLIPCPAAFSILVICLQVKQFSLGFGLVVAFSIGLALTLVTTGSIAAWSVRHAEKQFKGFGNFARKLPYISSAFLFLVAVYMGATGWRGLAALH